MNPRERAAMPTEPGPHREPSDGADRFALGVTRLLRCFADTLFAKRCGHPAIVLETGAAVPGMVGAMATHLQCLRRFVDDVWIRSLMEAAANHPPIQRRSRRTLTLPTPLGEPCDAC